ncbi:MAG TPA: sigma-70 family RNA polymerase sigma factor [Candidatus Acidoferrum sp.]|nr:sigma-70 family RNA polymerase sigma factor [Candidatus Acidoferrum sp.]
MASASVVFDSYSFANVPRPQPIAAAKRSALADARSGNAEAFAEMVMPYASGLYRRALRMTGSPADAEDVRQDALLKAFSRLHQFAGQHSEQKDELHAWVSRIATNSSIDLIRQRRDSRYISLEEPCSSTEETFGSRLAAPADNPEERYSRREMRRIIAGVIACLPADLRQICLLRDVLQYSTHEVAARLHISSVAVRLRLFRAHCRLRDDLRDRLRRKQPRRPGQVSALSRRKPETATGKELFLPVAASAEFACGD